MTTAVSEPTTSTKLREPRDYLDPEHWDKLVGLLMRDLPWDKVMAERCLGQAVAYLITAMECRGRGLGLGPGELVDHAVHTVMLDTRNYFDFCTKYNDGEYLHHVPEVERKSDGSVVRTAQQIEAHGFPVDWSLWEADATKCTPCRPGEDGH